MHDHTPRHGGVVSMAGGVHFEVVAQPDGRVRVYLTDRRRRPLAPEGASGAVVLADDGARLPLVAVEDRLEAQGPALPVGDVRIRLDLVHDRRTVDVHLVVPVGIAPGLAGLPRACGAPLGPAARGELLPRCTVEFPRMVRALAATADARLLLVGVFAHGVSVWRLPAVEAVGAFEPAPGVDAHPGHDHPIDALAVRADGCEAAVAVRRQLARYALPDGKLLRAFPRDHHRIHALGYAPDGGALLATKLVDGTVELLDPEDGSERGRLRADRPLTAAAFAADGRLVVAASELGPLSLFVPPAAAAHRVLEGTLPARSVVLAGEHVIAATDDGALAFWALADGAAAVRSAPTSPALTLAVRPGNRVLASGCQDGGIRIYTLPDGRLVRTLRWHAAPIQALAWAGDLLASGDTSGGLALWDADEIVEAGAS
jgi:WD40 repeat protein